MTPTEIYPIVLVYIGGKLTVICRMHSACSPNKDRSYRCIIVGSKYEVIDFDAVKIKMDIERGLESRKSVDALALPPNQSALCFVELKSWDLLLSNGGTESKVRKQAAKYASDLPQKLIDSLSICRDITGDENTFDGCRIIYILVTDISVESNGLDALNADLSALAGIGSNLSWLCNKLSRDIMNSIPDIETRYWECRNFDKEIAAL